MRPLNLLKVIKENFSVKIFIIFTLLIITVSSFLTTIFILHQKKTLTDNLIKKGELIAELLAYDSKLGVFTENKDLLMNAGEGFLQRGEVMALSIFTSEGKLLIKQEKGNKMHGKSMEEDQGKVRYIIERVKKSQAPFHYESADSVEFWSPVVSSSKYFIKETPLFDNNAFRRKDLMIGLVTVTLDKAMLNKQLHSLVVEGILIGVIFLAISFVAIYHSVKKVTKPLNKLTEGVKALGRGDHVDEVPVETTDEVGRLACAFNNMVTERIRIEEAILGSEKKYRDLVNNALVGVYKTNLKGDVLYVNEALWKMLEFESAEEMVGEGILTRYKNPKDRETLLENLRENNKIENFEIALVTKTGQSKNIILSAALDGDIISGMIMDITERKNAEEALRESKELFEKIFFSQQDAIFILDSATPSKIMDCNPGVTNVFGYTRQEIIGRTTDILHVDDTSLKEFREYLYPAIAKSGFLHLDEFRMRRKDGTGFSTEHNVMPLEDEQGERIGWVSVVRDITERKQAEQALKESEEKFRNLAEKSPNMIFINLKGRVVYVNEKCEEVMEYKREEFYSPAFDFHALIASEFIDLINNNFRRHMKGEEIDPYEYTLITKTGKKIETIITTKLIEYQGEKAILGIITDITERKHVEEEREYLFKQVRTSQEQLQSLLRRLIEVQEADRRYLASELHDQVGQNLTALGINLNIIRSQFSEEAGKKIMDRLEDSLKLVEETIERTRSVIGGLRPPVLEDYGLGVALRWYTERFSERTGVVTLLREEEFSSRLPLAVETTLFRIVQEVLTNVAKHAQARQVDIILERMDGLIQLSISDDGVGFDPKVLRQVKKQPGWGLITIEERAKALGGHISVESMPGRGTRVMVQMPC